MLSNIERIARALERIADALEERQALGSLGTTLDRLKAELVAEAAGGSTK
jgi:hypothetical protein